MNKTKILMYLMIATGVGCAEYEPGPEDLGEDVAELHGPAVVASGPKSTGMVRFYGCPGCRGSSTLIRRDMVITNKHVVDWTGASSIYLNFTDNPSTSSRNFPAAQKWHAPSADLAIIQLSCAIHNSEVPAVPLATTDADLTGAASVTLSGYGPTSWNGTDYGIKRQGTIAMPATPAAFSWNASTWWTSGLVGSAPGDSGGSLYAQVGLVRKLAGVITWGSSNDASHYTAGQRIPPNLAWINSVLAAAPMKPDCGLIDDDDPPGGD